MPPPELPTLTLLQRAVVAAFGAFVVLTGTAGPLLGAEPIDARDPGPMPHRRFVSNRPPTPSPTAAPTPAPDPSGGATLGYDVSWPQCDDEHPEPIGFAIVGVNGGRVYKPNPCLAAQLAWAGPGSDLYMNTANPGPGNSEFWPSGQERPRECDTDATPGPGTPDCAYLYGWNAAADSYRLALAAYVELGWTDAAEERLPGDITWWLDVETANSWQHDRSLNVAALRGVVDFLESMKVEEVGFYSTPLLWLRVTGSTDAFAAYPAWHAGAHSREEAEERCAHDAFTGGELRFVQWIENGIDTNLRCP
jgi:hypothetical protein